MHRLKPARYNLQEVLSSSLEQLELFLPPNYTVVHRLVVPLNVPHNSLQFDGLGADLDTSAVLGCNIVVDDKDEVLLQSHNYRGNGGDFDVEYGLPQQCLAFQEQHESLKSDQQFFFFEGKRNKCNTPESQRKLLPKHTIWKQH